eukprot:TRINITY_DN7638_c0_g1_i1.p1 TRINITY_DN7638_c0_g1~~TRINITY_DN7638_c0_g1_i1.p1  ORF type:complete len:1024 (+),score=273.72 TRINITY_DN7638_c0_g1_i1:183-3254(+)
MDISDAETLRQTLLASIEEVDAIDKVLNKYETGVGSKDKKLLAQATTSLKKVTVDMKGFSSNALSKTKENAPLLNQLSRQMKELVGRMRVLLDVNASARTSTNLSTSETTAAGPSQPAPSAAAPEQISKSSDQQVLSNTIQSASDRTSRRYSYQQPVIEVKQEIAMEAPKPLRGWLKKQGEDLFKAWKKRFFQQNQSKLFYYKSENDSEHLGFIDLAQVVNVNTLNINHFELATATRTYHLQTIREEKSELQYWTDGIAIWMRYLKMRSSDSDRRRTITPEALDKRISVVLAEPASAPAPAVAVTTPAATAPAATPEKQTAPAETERDRRKSVNAATADTPAIIIERKETPPPEPERQRAPSLTKTDERQRAPSKPEERQQAPSLSKPEERQRAPSLTKVDQVEERPAAAAEGRTRAPSASNSYTEERQRAPSLTKNEERPRAPSVSAPEERTRAGSQSKEVEEKPRAPSVSKYEEKATPAIHTEEKHHPVAEPILVSPRGQTEQNAHDAPKVESHAKAETSHHHEQTAHHETQTKSSAHETTSKNDERTRAPSLSKPEERPRAPSLSKPEEKQPAPSFSKPEEKATANDSHSPVGSSDSGSTPRTTASEPTTPMKSNPDTANAGKPRSSSVQTSAQPTAVNLTTSPHAQDTARSPPQNNSDASPYSHSSSNQTTPPSNSKGQNAVTPAQNSSTNRSPPGNSAPNSAGSSSRRSLIYSPDDGKKDSVPLTPRISKEVLAEIENPSLLDAELEGKDKDEQISFLKERFSLIGRQFQTHELNLQLFAKIQDELKQKEKSYELIKHKQQADQEGKRLAEERLEVLRIQMKEKEEECLAKDKNIRQLSKKLKENRAEWLASGGNQNASIGAADSWKLKPEIDVKNREIKSLRDAIWAHQTQNQLLTSEIMQVENDTKAKLKVKDEHIRKLEKELEFVRNAFQGVREKYLNQQVGLLGEEDAELQQVKKEYFFTLAVSCKLSSAKPSNMNVMELFERALGENVDWKKWPEWISTQLFTSGKKGDIDHQ